MDGFFAITFDLPYWKIFPKHTTYNAPQGALTEGQARQPRTLMGNPFFVLRRKTSQLTATGNLNPFDLTLTWTSPTLEKTRSAE
jgi:hypothetical protein